MIGWSPTSRQCLTMIRQSRGSWEQKLLSQLQTVASHLNQWSLIALPAGLPSQGSRCSWMSFLMFWKKIQISLIQKKDLKVETKQSVIQVIFESSCIKMSKRTINSWGCLGQFAKWRDILPLACLIKYQIQGYIEINQKLHHTEQSQ